MLESTAVCAEPENSGRLQFQDFLGCKHVSWDEFWMWSFGVLDAENLMMPHIQLSSFPSGCLGCLQVASTVQTWAVTSAASSTLTGMKVPLPAPANSPTTL